MTDLTTPANWPFPTWRNGKIVKPRPQPRKTPNAPTAPF